MTNRADLDQILTVANNRSGQTFRYGWQAGGYRLVVDEDGGVREISPRLAATAMYK